jgi:hypothetical protein
MLVKMEIPENTVIRSLQLIRIEVLYHNYQGIFKHLDNLIIKLFTVFYYLLP